MAGYQLITATPWTRGKAFTTAAVAFAFVCGLLIGYAVYSNLNTGLTSENLGHVKDFNIKSDHLQGNSNLSQKNLDNKTQPTIEPITVASTAGLTTSTTASSIKKAPKDKGPASVHCDDEDDCIGGFGSGESPVDDSNNGYDHPYSPGDNKKPTPDRLDDNGSEVYGEPGDKYISKPCSTDADCAQTRACKDQECTRATCGSKCGENLTCVLKNHKGTCLPLCKVTCSDNLRKRRSPRYDLDIIEIKKSAKCQLKLFARTDLKGYRCTVETEEETCFIRKRQISQFAKVKNRWLKKGIKSAEVLGDCSWDITGKMPGDVSRLGGNNKKVYKSYSSFRLKSQPLSTMQKVPTKQT